ncbi:hypothetical protein RvY_03346 [Ramazzottius varieornatus]|uniref:Uncharacterized protein n=1 Tax=Ramazzottius varieornatus TaxID=947166 RepID=A0A1D1UXY0_RAMVA|nr:hypothetical protein RvY_03346 [Ramazzottius varieornatus]
MDEETIVPGATDERKEASQLVKHHINQEGKDGTKVKSYADQSHFRWLARSMGPLTQLMAGSWLLA